MQRLPLKYHACIELKTAAILYPVISPCCRCAVLFLHGGRVSLWILRNITLCPWVNIVIHEHRLHGCLIVNSDKLDIAVIAQFKGMVCKQIAHGGCHLLCRWEHQPLLNDCALGQVWVLNGLVGTRQVSVRAKCEYSCRTDATVLVGRHL